MNGANSILALGPCAAAFAATQDLAFHFVEKTDSSFAPGAQPARWRKEDHDH